MTPLTGEFVDAIVGHPRDVLNEVVAWLRTVAPERRQAAMSNILAIVSTAEFERGQVGDRRFDLNARRCDGERHQEFGMTFGRCLNDSRN